MAEPSPHKTPLQTLSKVNEAYSAEPWWYDIRGYFILTFAYRSSLLFQLRFFSKGISDNHLEAAIGSGTLFELILHWMKVHDRKPKRVVGFDYAEKMIGGARLRFKNNASIELIQADIGSLPFEANQFQSCNIANAIHSLPDPARGLTELNRVLASEGILSGNVLLPPKGPWPFDRIANRINAWGTRKGILNRPYRRDEVESMLTVAGFEIFESNLHGNCFSFRARKRTAHS